jgi:hypothetical protein
LFCRTNFTQGSVDINLFIRHYLGEIGLCLILMKIFTWKQRATVLLVTVSMVSLFGLAGWGIGYAAGNYKAGIFIAVLISWPFTQWALVRQILKVHEVEARDEASS